MIKSLVITASVLLAPVLAGVAWSAGLIINLTQLWQVLLFAWPACIAAGWIVLSFVLRTAPATRPQAHSWSAASKLFHWIMALTILGTTALMYYIVNFPDLVDDTAQRAEYARLLKHHKSLGLVILFLVAFRFSWNRWRTRPPLPSGMTATQVRASTSVHSLIYLGMLIVPLLGWSASMTYGARTHFFGLFELPVLLPKNVEWANILQPAHIWAAWGMLTLVGLHLIAALWHHFIRRDATLVQMLPRVSRGASEPPVPDG